MSSTTTETLAEDASELSSEGTSAELSKDKIFHILQTQRRRDVLRYLKNNEGAVEMRSLAEQVAVWENNTSMAELTSNERQRVYIALYQSHLPKLDEEDVIEYNQSRGIVERGTFADQFDPYLEAHNETTPDGDKHGNTTNHRDKDDDRKWSRIYRWATAASAGTLTAAWLGLPIIGSLTSSVLGGLIISTYVAIAVAQLASH